MDSFTFYLLLDFVVVYHYLWTHFGFSLLNCYSHIFLHTLTFSDTKHKPNAIVFTKSKWKRNHFQSESRKLKFSSGINRKMLFQLLYSIHAYKYILAIEKVSAPYKLQPHRHRQSIKIKYCYIQINHHQHAFQYSYRQWRRNMW